MRPWRGTWLSVIGAGLAIALVAVALVQGRQATLLNETVKTGDDYVVLTVYQAETEYLRLRNEWQRAADGVRPIDREALQLRYDIWVSRMGLLRNERTSGALFAQPVFRDTLTRVDGFLAQADRMLGEKPTQPLSRDGLAQLLPELESLGVPIHGVSLHAAHHVGDQLARRNLAVRQHNQVGIGLTVFLSALTLAFALLALRQMRQL